MELLQAICVSSIPKCDGIRCINVAGLDLHSMMSAHERNVEEWLLVIQDVSTRVFDSSRDIFEVDRRLTSSCSTEFPFRVDTGPVSSLS